MSAEFSAEKPDFSVEKMHVIAGDRSPPPRLSLRKRFSPDASSASLECRPSQKRGVNAQEYFRLSTKARKQGKVFGFTDSHEDIAFETGDLGIPEELEEFQSMKTIAAAVHETLGIN